MPYCSFILCRKDTTWRFDSDHTHSTWYVCESCHERYAVYKTPDSSTTLLRSALQLAGKVGERLSDTVQRIT